MRTDTAAFVAVTEGTPPLFDWCAEGYEPSSFVFKSSSENVDEDFSVPLKSHLNTYYIVISLLFQFVYYFHNKFYLGTCVCPLSHHYVECDVLQDSCENKKEACPKVNVQRG